MNNLMYSNKSPLHKDGCDDGWTQKTNSVSSVHSIAHTHPVKHWGSQSLVCEWWRVMFELTSGLRCNDNKNWSPLQSLTASFFTSIFILSFPQNVISMCYSWLTYSTSPLSANYFAALSHFTVHAFCAFKIVQSNSLPCSYPTVAVFCSPPTSFPCCHGSPILHLRCSYLWHLSPSM